MAALSGIKRRIRSVTSTKQITKAMQLVAASKLRRAQESATGPQAYTEAAKAILAQLSGGVEAGRNPLFQVRTIERDLTIIVGGDRGMAGAYNSNITKAFIKHVSSIKAGHDVIAVGRRAASYGAHLSDITELAAYEMDINEADVGLAKPILDEVVELFRDGKIDAVYLVYTHFVST
ncbi:MAG: FoF1 ATP synthase subunit gamma, partial [Candidatus Saccharibacteria bacterium]